FFVTASDTLGWTVVSTSIGDLLGYLPKLFSAIIIFVIGFYISTMVRKALHGILESLSISSGVMLSSIAFYIILVVITLTALNQAGIDTSIITSNVTLIVGGFLLAFAISFGLGSRDVLANILSSFYAKRNFEIGQKITVKGISGTIEMLDGASCVIKTAKGKTIIPSKYLLTEEVVVED
ncbi:MAG: mechanosensitive ion channel, partial [Cytophagales bacterium]